jgi:hypothetical protein
MDKPDVHQAGAGPAVLTHEAKRPPLVKRPIQEIAAIAREAGRTAFGNAEIAERLWMEARHIWIGEAFPNGLDLTDDEFDVVIVRAADAFEEGIDDYLDRPLAAQIAPGVRP